MIDPAPALDRPRVVGRDGEFRPLEDVIDKLMLLLGSLCETVQVIDAGLSIRPSFLRWIWSLLMRRRD